jgi:hypothetical protein
MATALTSGDTGDEGDSAVQLTHDARFHFRTAATRDYLVSGE